jgi:hypothetical protein
MRARSDKPARKEAILGWLDAPPKYKTAKNLQEYCGTLPERRTFF